MAKKTYEEFEADARASGLYDTFDAKDLERAKTDTSFGYGLLNDKKGWKAAEAAGDKEGMEFYAGLGKTRRETFDSSQKNSSNNVLALIKQYDDSLPKESGSKYLTTIDRLLAKIAGDKFSYDAESDPRYSLAQEYAKKAMENQMAESALLTGGYGNSYAAASGQQVYTDYMNEAVNDMEDRAYNKWAAERDNNYSLLGIIRDMEREDYERSQNAKKESTAAAETKKTNAQDIVYSYIQMTGGIDGLTEDELAATGWSKEYINALVTEAQSAKAEEDAAAGVPEISAEEALGYYMGGNKSEKVRAAMLYHFGEDYEENANTYYENMLKLQNSGDDSNKPVISREDAVEAYLDGKKSANVVAAMKYYYGDDFEGYFNDEAKVPETVYSDAMNYLAREGVSPAYTGLLMSPVDFENSLKKYGSTVAEIDGSQITFYSYEDYVDKFAEVYSKKKAPVNGDGATMLSESQFESKKRGGSVTIDGRVFDSYGDYKRYMEEEYAYGV